MNTLCKGEEYLVGGPMPDIISNRQLHAVFAAFRNILTKSNGAEQETSETDILTKSSKPRSARETGKGTKGKNDHKEEKGKKEPEMARAASRKANKERGVDFFCCKFFFLIEL